MLRASNAWIATDHGLGTDQRLAPYILVLKGDRSLYQTIEEDDWVLVLNPAGGVTRVGRVLRVRSNLETTTLYFDRLLSVTEPGLIGLGALAPPSSGSIGRIQWTDFVETLPRALHKTIAEVPTVGLDARSSQHQQELAYIRELLQLAVMDDLLGPAGGPHERIVDMGVRDRYLVGKLAPREAAQGGIEGLEGPLANEDAEEPTDPKAPGQHEPGAEFGTATGRVEPESDAADEIDAASNQSLVPSSLGMTFCVDGDAERIEIEVRWGRYERSDEHEIFRTRKNKETGAEEQTKAKVWQRIPCGGKLVLSLTEGVIPHQAPDKSY
ncbi:MAG: helicase, partial [Pseudomonas sp.]